MTATATENTRAVAGNNNPPEPTPFEVVAAEINDLFDEAKHWADGLPIEDEATHDAVTALRDAIHEAGKRADVLRVDEKKPHDDAVRAIQARYNPLIQDKRGKVDIAKSALGTLLAGYREKKAEAARIEAARVAAIAAAEAEKARLAMVASAGNIEARLDAEEQAEHAKAWTKAAKQADKAANTGAGLRTIWTATMVDEESAMEWCWARAKDELLAVAQSNADAAVRAGVRAVPGFDVKDRKVV